MLTNRISPLLQHDKQVLSTVNSVSATLNLVLLKVVLSDESRMIITFTLSTLLENLTGIISILNGEYDALPELTAPSNAAWLTEIVVPFTSIHGTEFTP
jgi:hypothetical protein